MCGEIPLQLCSPLQLHPGYDTSRASIGTRLDRRTSWHCANQCADLNHASALGSSLRAAAAVACALRQAHQQTNEGLPKSAPGATAGEAAPPEAEPCASAGEARSATGDTGSAADARGSAAGAPSSSAEPSVSSPAAGDSTDAPSGAAVGRPASRTTCARAGAGSHAHLSCS